MPASPRSPLRSRLPALSALPALVAPAVALLFAGWCGTFYFGASAAGAIAAQAALVALGAAGLAICGGAGPSSSSEDRFDPLGLGSSGRLLPPALLAAVALAWWTSPVARAGRIGLVLLPALLAAPALIALCWREGRRVIAARGLAAVVAGVSLWGLVSWLVGPAQRPAEPLGHHLLLATWIVTLLPLAALPLGEDGSGREAGRGLGAVALLTGVAAVLATRSVAGGLALAVEAGLLLGVAGRGSGLSAPLARLGRAARGWPLVRTLAAVAAVLFTAAALWADAASLAARLVYWRAGWTGVLERPWTGFGPGSTAWTLAAFLRPIPGVNPPGEVVGELHLAPLAVAYEIGLPGLVLALGMGLVFAVRAVRALRRGAEGRQSAADPELALAGLAGLAGALVMGLATAEWRVTALPVAVAIAVGAVLAGCRGRVSRGQGVGDTGARRWLGPAIAVLYVGVAVAVLVPVDRAQLAYERAADPVRDRPGSDARRSADALREAVRLDPAFPLYRFHAARAEWLTGSSAVDGSPGETAWHLAREALAAAGAARGVAALWLRGGAAAAAAGRPGVAAAALETACGLDPMGAVAPFSLLTTGSPLYRREALGARALAAEPRLGAALLWQEQPELLDRALDTLAAAEGIDEGWREQVVARVRELHRRPAGRERSTVATVALVVDGQPASALSLHTFRRLPRRVELVPVPVVRSMAEALATLPPASALPGTDPRLFPPTCTGPFSPQTLRKTLWKTW